MFGLTPLGIVHTAISLVALVAGFVALIRDREISPANGLGQVYLWTTVLTCLTGFGIFQHGGFGKPHALGVITLAVLAFAGAVHKGLLLDGARKYIVPASFTLTLFFHFVPGITETFTRVPAGAPLFSSPEDPALTRVVGIVFLAFAVVIALQMRRVRHRSVGSPLPTLARRM